ncbi:gliding motility-associated C-terminal domain-containing protein [Flavobacterium sp. H4147]|uniref:gliding motility-associated C-terminal domain-containing protein n=1 Tax=Flavobacterium sp. H4147 TaxID=3034149 RepID=UPI0023ECD6FE|nr:gliding motility-associated C-terminal domain-containing protein [Flavobacterium sp. H4147]
MKDNITHKIVKKSGLVLSFTLIALANQNAHAQFVNKGDVKVSNGTLLSVHMDYENKDTGNFINDGAVHIFQNWSNEGIVSFTQSLAGKTFFTGTEEQIIENKDVSDFQNVQFNNGATKMPFILSGDISVATTAEFIKGIIDGDSVGGLVIFKENAGHTGAGNNTGFVDGPVQKIGKKAFEFPVGDAFHYRPSIHADGNDIGNIYTTHYFLQNSEPIHTHSIKDKNITFINDKEYWMVTEDQGSEKIVLSLTMDNSTTPQVFFDTTDSDVVIVRWDESKGEWINEGGAVSDSSLGAPYSNLVTAQVSGYGMFTLGLVKKIVDEPTDVVIYNAISPNDDGKNDSFLIENISKFPDNEVEIYNRWGVKVFGTKSYNESDNMFRGYSDGRVTVNRGEKLPTGTYFYILKYNNGTKTVEKSGYLYINNQ